MEKGTTAAEQSQYKDMRYLCEMLRKLGYPRVVSLDSFKKPNFQLVAEILDHLAQRIDPSADIPTSIDSMADRVRFMKAVCGLIASKARIKISAINLYSADFHAVPELTKIASMLYGVYTSMNSSTELSRQTFSIPVKYNKTAVRDMANEIDSIAQRVFEVLGKEDQLKEKRMEAIKFIDKLSKNYSGEEQVYIKECVEKLITQQKESVSAMEGYVKTLQEDERTLEEKIKKKNLDIERAIKRLKAMDKKPAHMEEMEARERELERLFTEYMEKFKNLDHLNQLVDIYNAKENEKREKEKSALSSLQKKMQSEEDKLMNLDEKKVSGGGAGAGTKKLAVRGNLRGDAVSSSLTAGRVLRLGTMVEWWLTPNPRLKPQTQTPELCIRWMDPEANSSPGVLGAQWA